MADYVKLCSFCMVMECNLSPKSNNHKRITANWLPAMSMRGVIQGFDRRLKSSEQSLTIGVFLKFVWHVLLRQICQWKKQCETIVAFDGNKKHILSAYTVETTPNVISVLWN